MQIKSSFHIHTNDDPREGEAIDYGVRELVDFAVARGFKALAFTCHDRFVYREEYGKYAAEKGVLLIPGVELSLKEPGKARKSHVLVLNCGADVDEVKSFDDLAGYRERYPEIFVIAPHPGFSIFQSISIKGLKKYIKLFDAIEHSWFFTPRIDLNRRSEKIARDNNLPFLATADAHILKYFNDNYFVAEAETFAPEAIFSAIRAGKFENFFRPRNELILAYHTIAMEIKLALLASGKKLGVKHQ